MYSRCATIMWLALFLISPVSPSYSADLQIKVMQKGQNITVWDGWNVSGDIFLKVDGESGQDCIRLWWIRMGVNSDSWAVCDTAQVSFNLPLIYGELRAGHAQRELVISVADNADVAYSQKLCDRVIDR